MRYVLFALFMVFAAGTHAAPYALIDATGQVREIREWGTETPPADLFQREGVFWLPFEVTDPPFDQATQVREGPVQTILANKVTRVWTVRAKTAQELADDLAVDQQAQIDNIGEVGFKALYLLDARARKLRGDPAISEPTFQGQLKALRNNPVPNPDPRAPMTLLRFDTTVTIGAVAGAAFTDKTFTVTGLQTTDLVLSATFSGGLSPNTIGFQVLRVSAADTLAIRFFKIATGSVTPPAPQALTVLIWRP